MGEVLKLHYHTNFETLKEYVCRDAKCYQKKLEERKALEEYIQKVDLDLARKDNLDRIEDMIQDLRIDYYNSY